MQAPIVFVANMFRSEIFKEFCDLFAFLFVTPEIAKKLSGRRNLPRRLTLAIFGVMGRIFGERHVAPKSFERGLKRNAYFLADAYYFTCWAFVILAVLDIFFALTVVYFGEAHFSIVPLARYFLFCLGIQAAFVMPVFLFFTWAYIMSNYKLRYILFLIGMVLFLFARITGVIISFDKPEHL